MGRWGDGEIGEIGRWGDRGDRGEWEDFIHDRINTPLELTLQRSLRVASKA